jgi:hypothetical protein
MLFIFSAFIATIQNTIPIQFPFLAPIKWAVAAQAYFRRKVFFFDGFHILLRKHMIF